MKRLFIGLLLFVFSTLTFAVVDLNTASQVELEQVKGIGPKKAQAIIEYRQKNGGFKNVEDLKNIKGFGDKSFEKIKGDFSVGNKTNNSVKTNNTPKKEKDNKQNKENKKN